MMLKQRTPTSSLSSHNHGANGNGVSSNGGGTYKDKKSRAKTPRSVFCGLVIFAAAAAVSFYMYQDEQEIRHRPGRDGPPRSLWVHGKRSNYTPVPKWAEGMFLAEGKAESTMTRAFRARGWKKVDKHEQAHIYYRARGAKGRYYYTYLKPWQRYSRVPGFNILESKDGFLAGFRDYQKAHPEKKNALYFLPETYRLTMEPSEREIFTDILQKQGGMNRPWVLKNVNENNGKGIEMLGPNSKGLETAVSRVAADKNHTYIVQAYICNELAWRNGNKFDLRFFWMVASIDPLIVLYHDGYVRVSAGKYDESNFNSTGQHLTNHGFRGTEQEQGVTHRDLWDLVENHYKENRRELARKIPKRNRNDPVAHVKAQLKQALATTVAAFKNDTFGGDTKIAVGPENLFGVYGADFIIDKDLDAYYIEAQASPGFGESYDWRIEFFRWLYRPVGDIVNEIAYKQTANPRGNILPLETLDGWEVVYAGDWMYEYKGYERSKVKKPCSLPGKGGDSDAGETKMMDTLLRRAATGGKYEK